MKQAALMQVWKRVCAAGADLAWVLQEPVLKQCSLGFFNTFLNASAWSISQAEAELASKDAKAAKEEAAEAHESNMQLMADLQVK